MELCLQLLLGKVIDLLDAERVVRTRRIVVSMGRIVLLGRLVGGGGEEGDAAEAGASVAVEEGHLGAAGESELWFKKSKVFY